jgi:hypothetical protein
VAAGEIFPSPLLEEADPGARVGDTASDADALIDTLAERQVTPVIPSRRRRKTSLPRDFAVLPSIASSIQISIQKA